MRSGWWVAALLAVTGCRSSERFVRLDTGRGEPIVFTPRATADQRVKLDEREVRRALAQLGREVHPPANPQEAARHLFELGARSGWFQYDARGRRLVPLGRGETLEDEGSAAEKALTRDYLSWCERKGSLGDCMRLLMEGPLLTGDGRYALAMAFAKGAVLDEMKEAFQGMANPEAVLSAVLWTCTTYLLLLAAPEPLSKGIAAVLTAALIAWVGFDTFWSLIVGFKQMVEEADRAVTFDDLRQAGARYGKVMGRSAARAFVMLATAAIGTTAAGLARRLPTLPGAAEAAAQARGQLGIQLSGVGAVTAVAVNASTVTISLASGAVAMSGHDGTESATPPSPSGEAPEHQTGALTAGKNFKEHFITKRPLLEKALGIKIGKLKEGGGETFLKTLTHAINNGTFKYVGRGILKKGMEAMNIYRGKGLTVVVKMSGEWVTLLETGEGLDLAIQMLP